MSDSAAGTGFSRGFFGCFGVLAAVAAVGAGLLLLLAISARTDAARDKAIAPLASTDPAGRAAIRPEQPELERMCRAVLPQAEKVYAIKGHLRRNGPASLGSGNAAGTADCPARDRLGEIEVGLNLTCADGENVNCYAVADMIRVDTLTRIPAR